MVRRFIAYYRSHKLLFGADMAASLRMGSDVLVGTAFMAMLMPATRLFFKNVRSSIKRSFIVFIYI